ncbi:histidine kinase [Christensenella intestinihominis]|uniref:histidine kinase n=1 Tax=Christensenella intestinihominis TaxID=1851429 RepID=UPI000829A205|nr:histidine kinase [Christensenella intestinihominis]
MGTIGSINISLEIFGSLISFIIILCLAISENRHTRLNRLYLRVVICNIAVMLCDALAIALKGGMDPVNYYGVRIANFCAFCLDYVIVALFADYLEAFIATKTKPSPRPFRIVRAICATGILLVVISQWNHMYYRIDENNMYVRGDWFWLSQAVGLLCAAVYLCVIFRYRKHMKKKEFYLFLLYIMAPGIAAVVQTWIYGIALLYIATTLFVLGVYIVIQSDQTRLLKEKELELAESRIDIMLSQIQPHFLYNSLTAIRELCMRDPEEAWEAIGTFSSYLRGNIDSLTQERMILFRKELEHVKAYLSLEEKRLGEKLRVVFRIEAEDFMLPALTLQPVVENAVRYGIEGRKNGGTVTIETFRKEDGVHIVVTDDGPGFEPGKPKQDGRGHVGLANVGGRLASVCGGSLEIKSGPGAGTGVTIIVPQGGLFK